MLVLSFIISCSHPQRQTYPYIGDSLDQIGLVCTNDQALILARDAALEKFPELEKKLTENPFSIFKSWYGGDTGKMSYKYSLKAIFYYYSLGKPEEGKYYEESVEVLMTKNCVVNDVIYLKDRLQVTY